MLFSRLTRTLTVTSLVAFAFVPIAASAATVTLTPLGSKPVIASSISCGIPDAPARITSPWLPSVPAFIRQRNLGESYGSADVALVLESNGAVQSVRVLTSSGSSMLDHAALTAARLSRYAAERSGCVAHGGRYALHVDFDD